MTLNEVTISGAILEERHRAQIALRDTDAAVMSRQAAELVAERPGR